MWVVIQPVSKPKICVCRSYIYSHIYIQISIIVLNNSYTSYILEGDSFKKRNLRDRGGSAEVVFHNIHL